MLNPELTHLESSHSLTHKTPLTIKIMPVTTRNRTKSNSLGPSGSEYNASEASVAGADIDAEGEEEEAVPSFMLSKRGRKVKAIAYQESSENDDDLNVIDKPAKVEDLFGADVKVKSRSPVNHDDDEDDQQPRRRSSRRHTRNLPDFVEDDDEGDPDAGYNTRRKTRSANVSKPNNGSTSHQRSTRSTRRLGRLRRGDKEPEDDQYVDEDEPSSADADGSVDDGDDAMGTSDLEVTLEPEPEPEPEPDDDNDGKPYAFRQRAKINYAIPPPLEDMPKPAQKPTVNRHGGRGGNHSRGRKGPGWSASGAELGRWMGDDSDSDHPTRTPRKQPFGQMGPYGGAVAAGGMLPGDLASGTPSNLGKIGDAALADADPLGVNTNVTFDEVGGLDEHIHSLKEMTLLPLLYPEVFQKFNVTPPRGVLFHGPPGTGKTLLARALAASCRSNGRSISFFMRKGADCLSKWVGEAERQLRLLFEEAKNSQPSIIFFDEIDGLAPVRSSKQDQIHASIVSTLLALMDGMDGRGQVVVIGATNRPDAVDPALRRPGRFDREFYFPLPKLEAREKILSIMTKDWQGWGLDKDEKAQERLHGLAKLTKGYGGADLRALCTEAALNAVQRRYPQIYKSTERLVLNPETIGVQLRDFMISIKKLVPSSARSSSSAANPLPQQLVPLLGDTLERTKASIGKVLPLDKKLTALEEAEFEDVGGEDGALDREMFSQTMQTMRVYRPRILIHGPVGMGQSYIGAAALHHLEGYHAQTLELGTLLGDSTRTVESAIVQLFVEAKRHQPSIIYIPSLISWCATVSETSRTTVRAMLDTLSPTDPILLLAIVDGNFSSLPRDVKQWFGHLKENRVAISSPTPIQREEFFASLIDDIRRPPNHFPDGTERKKRVLEDLPIAPPLEPRKPTPAELALQVQNDIATVARLKVILGGILTELKRKFKRFTKRASEEYNYDFSEPQVPPSIPQITVEEVTTSTTIAAVTVTVTNKENEPHVNGVLETVDYGNQEQAMIDGHNIAAPEPEQPAPVEPRLHDIDLEKMSVDLYRDRYLTPQDFLADIEKIVFNTQVRANEDSERMFRAQAMLSAAQVSIYSFDANFVMECERMAVRERFRRDEHRKEKEKERQEEKEKERQEEKEKERQEEKEKEEAALATRRSTRSNGHLEISITDPVKLERRLKRQRGESAGSSNSEEDHGDNQERDSKRSRMSTEDEVVGRQPVIDPTSQRTPAHQRTVHFAAHPNVDPMQPLQLPVDQQVAETTTPSRNSMVVDSPRPRGFDPSLLNPLLPTEDVFSRTRTASPADTSRRSNSAVPPTLNHLLHPTPSEFIPSNTENPFYVPSSSNNPSDPRPISPQPPHTPSGQIKTPEPHVQLSPISVPMNIVVEERTPSPPLPDFHVDESLLDQLRTQLKEHTAELTIEQLEELRATCLGSVWRYRKEWDRDGLVRELCGFVKEFVEDVGDSAWNSSDDI